MSGSGSKLIGKAGMMLGIIVLGGSVVGGVALADLGPAPMSDPELQASATGRPGPSTDPGQPPTDQVSSTGAGTPTHIPTPAPKPTRNPAVDPSPTPRLTCWPKDAPGEHPDGIEDCEDTPSGR
ncbi:MAG TPA: hypothetical protein VF163_11600 [Micromonosporaceae bacterium]